MNEKDLLYFCKLVETGNYTATAELFDVTQPTISMAIKRLADKFNDPLILQKNRKSKITLTNAGELLYQKAKILLQDIASINYDVKHASDKKIRLAFSGEAGNSFIADIIMQFYQAGLTDLIDTNIERSTDAFSDLTNGEVDVAIYSWMVPINDPEYFVHNLKKTELVIITGLNDPWKEVSEVNASDLRNRKFIARSQGYLTRECLEEVGKLGNFSPDIIYTAQTMQTMIDLVKRNIGIALAMESSLKDETGIHVIHLKPGQKLYAYMQIAMRKSFVPNKYQKKGIEILRHFKP
ncbi:MULTISPECIES: LysR family transcriptional regulator [Lactobacillus]|uniref:LysR family transcriptional regulator n=1 Tax=Lactobacillus TaxID=1578 RepID=UPI001C6A3333|nr:MULTISPECIES: LysR family transcriptional regulator [Lactobacillus]MCX8721009.1 LysR family transcriptional regulator [Lactobacillus sp. B4010]MCX8722887.1 LysR family transcriptional regulator [Lactobacillus sp. B4005]MCX8732162.1 LysR family transcriptional regulator [Lactobacillus sp. B4015]MCX8734151.1 LysR family transcriptional regulator [Lactobacillus sp. B4012]QYN56684.1 LysR family transcriptional regulator [Lactobacillus panisapium]